MNLTSFLDLTSVTIPTCVIFRFLFPVAKKTRSPGARSFILTSEPTLLCCSELRGRLMSIDRNEFINKPEQSIPALVVPPYRYGVPIYVRAEEITFSTAASRTLAFLLAAQESIRSG